MPLLPRGCAHVYRQGREQTHRQADARHRSPPLARLRLLRTRRSQRARLPARRRGACRPGHGPDGSTPRIPPLCRRTCRRRHEQLPHGAGQCDHYRPELDPASPTRLPVGGVRSGRVGAGDDGPATLGPDRLAVAPRGRHRTDQKRPLGGAGLHTRAVPARAQGRIGGQAAQPVAEGLGPVRGTGSS